MKQELTGKSNKEFILTSILKGSWFANELAPRYKDRLSGAVVGQNSAIDLTSLALIYYGHVHNPREIDGLSEQRFFNPNQASRESVSLLSRLEKMVFSDKEGALVEFSEEESGKLTAAGDQLLKCWPDIARSFPLLSIFVRVTNAPVLGASFPHSFGAVFYGDNLSRISVDELSVSLAHELAHHELFLINLYDRLVVPEYDHNLKYAPLQKKERPPIGRLHAFYALFRMIQARKKLGLSIRNEMDLLDEAQNSLDEKEFTEYASQIKNSVMEAVTRL